MAQSQIQNQIMPKAIEEKIIAIRDRVKEIKKTYGSLARYGYPIIQSKDELVALIYANKVLGISEYELSNIIGVDKSTIYKLIKKFDNNEPINIFNPETRKVESIVLTIEDVKATVDEWLRPKAQKWIRDVTEASCVIEFLKNPVKIQKHGKHSIRYGRSQIMETLKALNDIARYIINNRDRLAQHFGYEIPSNPDLWDNEDTIYEIVRMVCYETYTDEKKIRSCVRRYLQRMKRIPKFREWFKGRIGSIRSVLSPKEATLFYEHYLKIKRYALETKDSNWLAFWLIAGLHIETGAREGWGSLKLKVERLVADGISVPYTESDIPRLDLDNDFVDTSLIGIKWDKAIWGVDGSLLGFRIWEEKTKKEWELRIPWLDKEIHDKLKEIYEWARTKGIKSVVKSILMYYNVRPSNSTWTVYEFQKWYSRMCSMLKDMLNLPWDITPHRLRSAHISILAEFRIPMELTLQSSANTGFGVGWDDISTAVLFYLRFSQTLIQDYLRQAEEIKQKIAQFT